MQDQQPRTSLRKFFSMWFVVFAIILAFITGLFFSKFKESINDELTKRLTGNIREVQIVFEEYSKYVENLSRNIARDSSLIFQIGNSSASEVALGLKARMRNVIPQQISAFSRDGQHLATVFRDKNGDLQSRQMARVGLSDRIIKTLETKNSQVDLYFSGKSNTEKKVELSYVTRLKTKSGQTAGYLEQIVLVDFLFLEGLKKRTNLEMLVFDNKQNIFLSSHPDFYLYPADYLASSLSLERPAFFELKMRDRPFGFYTGSIKWGDKKFLISLGGSKEKSEQTVKEVSFVILAAFFCLIAFLVISSFVTTRVILKPLYRLLEATHLTSQGVDAIQVPVTSNNELGVLTDSFNQMSKNIATARKELQSKVSELERANTEIKDAQSKLVHAAKMASVGQLVAGVAHELNNPIGFIYSNMTHLKDYTERMRRLIEAAEKGEDLSQLKEELEYDYVVEDMPRLIQSCEEGAKRTRDIVMGLRNFSRLEEAKLKKIDLIESVENTLNLLVGETKNRIQIHKDFQTVPLIECYASQINQVLMNILSNAAQAIEGNGEVWISIKPELKGKEVWVNFTVKDSGKGIQPSDMDKIFDPFYSTKPVGKGTGLGLSISYGIIKKHGGEIYVESKLGKGAEFTVLLPQHPKE